jgi:hypothetical protein
VGIGPWALRFLAHRHISAAQQFSRLRAGGHSALGKDGKPIAGAAKTAFVKKCKKNSCEPKAVSSDGKLLTGAAKNSFMKKCQDNASPRTGDRHQPLSGARRAKCLVDESRFDPQPTCLSVCVCGGGFQRVDFPNALHFCNGFALAYGL